MRRSVAVLSIASMAVLSACTSKPAPLATLQPLASGSSPASPASTAVSPTAPATGSVTPDPSASGTSPVTADLASVFRASATSSSEVGSARINMVVTLPGGKAAVTLTGVERWKGAFAADITANVQVTGQKIGMRELITPDAIYLKLAGAPAAHLPTPWVKLSIKDVGKMTGINLQQMLDQAKQSDPSKQLDLLAAAGDITKVGDETVDGQVLTHYKGTADFGKIMTAAGFDKKLLTQLQASGAKSIAYDLWINAAGLPVKLVETMGTHAGVVTSTVTLSDFGVPVVIKIPAPREVTDLGKMIGNRGIKPRV